MNPACQAAVDVGGQYGVRSEDPVVLQETNNTVVWLRPHEVVAKVGTRSDSRDALLREHGVARALSLVGAAVARPLARAAPTTHSTTGFVVTLWDRLERDDSTEPQGSTVGDSLRGLHEALDGCRVDLPDFRVGIRRARKALADSPPAALALPDRMFLAEVFDAILPELEARVFMSRPLHGEPHDGNRILTRGGIRWIDFESACRGPLEWDLAFLAEDARASFADANQALLALLSTLNSARVATWCWIQARFPDMRRHGQHHLDLLRRTWPT